MEIKCKYCKELKPASDYQEGNKSRCKACFLEYKAKIRERSREKTRIYDKEYRKNNKEKRSKTWLKWYLSKGKVNRKSTAGMINKWKVAHPEEYKATIKVNHALAKGEIIKPSACEGCDRKNTRLYGHHKDYKKPLSVVWLCGKCHRKEHPKGEIK